MLKTITRSTKIPAKRGVKKIHHRSRTSMDFLELYTDPQETKRSLDKALEEAQRGRLSKKL